MGERKEVPCLGVSYAVGGPFRFRVDSADRGFLKYRWKCVTATKKREKKESPRVLSI
jgi:hypothetical protein